MNWRLLLDEPSSGAWNMAVDESLLLSHTPGAAPVLRFYGWNPPCVSLGRFQSPLTSHPQNFVRRPTGGRAIWHQHEITYAVILREELLPRELHSIIGSYQWLSRAFIAGLETLGVQAQLAPGENHRQEKRSLEPQAGEHRLQELLSPEQGTGEAVAATHSTSHKAAARVENCFASAARSDFVVDGRKLIGAAQCRKYGAILQHGSILLSLDRAAWQREIGGSMESTVALDELGVQAPQSQIIAALCEGVQQVLGANLQASELSGPECELAAHLERTKYGNDEWNFRDNRLESVPNCLK